MADASAAASQGRITAASNPSEWNKENAIMMFNPSDQPKKQHAWEREPRPASKQSGRSRTIWKRHGTGPPDGRLIQPSTAAQVSPKKVLKKVCVPSEGSVQTPKHKRLGIAKAWDRRQSDRLHKLRSLKLTSPIKVRRDSVSDQETPLDPAPSFDTLQQHIDEGEENEIYKKGMPSVADSVEENESDTESEDTKADTDVFYDKVAGSAPVARNAPLDEGHSITQSDKADDDMRSNDNAFLEERRPEEEGPADVGEIPGDEAQLLADDQAYRRLLSVPDSPEGSNSDNGSQHAQSPIKNAEESAAIVVVDTKEPVQVDGSLKLNDMIAEQHLLFEHLHKIQVDVDTEKKPAAEEIFTTSDQDAVVSAVPTSAANLNLVEDLHSAQEELANAIVAEDETSIDSSDGSDEEADDRRIELNLGSPGTTGPIHLFGGATQNDDDETVAADSATQEKPESLIPDDDMFANLDEMISRPSTLSHSTVLAPSVDTVQRQPLVKSCPEDATEVVEETMTVTVQLNDNDDTEMLRDFLNRSRASKAARIAKRSSLNNKRDSDAVKLALASPRKPAEEDIDPTIDSPSKSEEVTVNMPPSNLETSLEVTTQDLGPADELSGSPSPPTSRRSTRSKESRSTPSSITIRRPDGSEPFLLKKSEAQELAIATRANTRRNKGGAVNAKLMLMRLKGMAPEAVPEGEKETAIKWNEQLVMYLGEKPDSLRQEDKNTEEHDEADITSKPRVRRKRTLGAMNGTPAKPMHSEGSIATGTTPATSLPAPKMRMAEIESETQTERLSVPGASHQPLPTKRKRAIPTPTSRVPKPASKSEPTHSLPPQRGLAQNSTTDVDTNTTSSNDSNSSNDTTAAAITKEPSVALESSSSAGPTPTMSSGNPSASAHATTSAIAIASAAASAGKKGLSAGILPRGVAKPVRETRSAVRRG